MDTQKLDLLKKIIRETGGAAVAFSGGVDSTLLVKIAHEVLGDRAIAITAKSETYPHRELEAAKEFARSTGIKHIVLETSELDIPGFADNPPDRCYFCKKELFTKLKEIAAAEGIYSVFDGSNHDDRNDHRPGMKAAKELGIISPLKQAGMTKDEIRELSKAYGLKTWDKPSYACLSSRFPYGTKITREKLNVLSEAEDFLRDLGFVQLRVRHHGDTARIELEKPDLVKAAALADTISAKLKELGFIYVTLDLSGYATGSMNFTLKKSDRFTESGQ